MSYTITNQRPAVLDPVHRVPLKGDLDPEAAIRSVLVDPLYTPLGQTPVDITDPAGNAFTEQDVLAAVYAACGEDVDPAAEKVLKNLYQQGLVHYDSANNLLVKEVFVVQAAHAHKMPRPGPSTIYTTAMDVIPAAKDLLAGNVADDGVFFASLAYRFSPDTLGFWFQSASGFEAFTNWLDLQVQAMSAVLPNRTTTLMQQFTSSSLKGLTESLVLRTDANSDNEEYSFARVLISLLMVYTRPQRTLRTTPGAGILPFTLSELFLPETLVLVNVEAHARATSKKIDNEWRLINASLRSPVKIVSHQHLSKLTALPRARAKAMAQVANAASNKMAANGRSAKITFRKQPPNSINILNGLLRAMKRLKEVNRSQNIYKKSKLTFAKANRRDPDDYNKMGRVTSTHYLPDLHVYLDCSGSISEDNYQQAVLMLIKLTKKMNVNLYFNSFSHVLSQEVLLKTQNKSVNQIWSEFRRVPKVNGGTEFSQVWRYINENPRRKQRLSLMITDFGWSAASQREEHPKRLYYAPVSNMDWATISHYAEQFEATMHHIEPAIAQRMIGMIR